VASEPNRVEGHFWLGANLGLYAESHSVLEGLREINNIRDNMETVIRLNSDCEQGSGLRTLARLPCIESPRQGTTHSFLNELKSCNPR
jgi:hypothetical protein